MFLYPSMYLATLDHAAVGSLLGVAAGAVLFLYSCSFRKAESNRRIASLDKVLKSRPGLVEVSGTACGPSNVTSPLTQTACFAYRTVVWRERGSGNESQFELLVEEKLQVPFYLDDGTGKILVDPAGANLDLRHDFRHECSEASLHKENPALKNLADLLKRHAVTGKSRLRVEEFCIKPNAQLFVRGTLAPNPGLIVSHRDSPAEKTPASEPAESFTSFASELPVPTIAVLESSNASKALLPESQPSELLEPEMSPADLMVALNGLVDLTGTVPAPESSTHMTQQGKIAAALQRAGVLMPDIRSLMVERDSSADELKLPTNDDKIHDEQSAAGDGTPSGDSKSKASTEFDLKPPLVVMKGSTPFDFVISWREKSIRPASSSWKATLLPWAGAALTLLCLFLFASRIGWL